MTNDASAWVSEPLRGARLLIHLTMALDVGVRTYLAPRRLRFLAHHKLDIVAVFAPPVRALREVVALGTILLRPGLVRFAAIASAIIAGCAVVVYAADHDQQGADIQSLGDAFWWAAVTATTVSYGDEVPITDQGRAVALLLMLLGIALFSVLTAHVAAYFVGGSRTGTGDNDMVDRLARIEVALASIEHRLDRQPPDDDPTSQDREPKRLSGAEPS